MHASTLVQGPARVTIHAEGCEPCVQDVRIATKEQNDFFVVGRFERLAHPGRRKRGSGDLHEVDFAQPLVVRVIPEDRKNPFCRWTQQRLAVLEAPLAASREHSLAGERGLEDREDLVARLVREGDDALDHVIALEPVMICEGLHMALCLREWARAAA